MNCIYSLACFCYDTNDILNKFPCLVCTCFLYLLYKLGRQSKLHLNFYPIKNLVTVASGYLDTFYHVQPLLGKSNPCIETDTNLLHKYELSFS